MIADMPFLLSAVSALVWLYLVLLHGGFWRCRERIDALAANAGGEQWPSVVAVVPARNEADVVGRAVVSLLTQTYPGSLHVFLVDDKSDDGTGDAALNAARRIEADDRLTVIRGVDRPTGWTGKLWAMQQAIDAADKRIPDAEFLWLTDADIEHDRNNARALVQVAQGISEDCGRPIAADCRCDLVSLMVKLHCASAWERLLIPAFVYFFQQLYPFAWCNRPDRRTAAAAGGCMLARRHALREAGGLAAFKGAIIDDCSLAKAIKHRVSPAARIWIGLTSTTRSLRPYEGLPAIWRMVARSAYTQLRHSPALLIGATVGMALIYLAPPLAFVWGLMTLQPAVAALAGGAYGLMAVSMAPIHRLYRLSPVRGLLLPVAAMLYVGMTVDSAWRTWRGRGGQWKGRIEGGGAGGA